MPLIMLLALGIGSPGLASAGSITVQLRDAAGQPAAGVAVYLESAEAGSVDPDPAIDGVMSQSELTFQPELLVVSTGADVAFPNLDAVSHHVYSFSYPNAFELPLYKGEQHQPVRFDHPGIVVLGCNIHDSMVAYILVVDTPYFSVTDASGKASIEVPANTDYRLSAWSPRFDSLKPDALGVMSQRTESVQLRLARRLAPVSSEAAETSSLVWGDY